MDRTFIDASDYQGRKPKIIKWGEPPGMEPGAPNPALKRVEDRLYLAYLCHNPAFPGWDNGAPPDHPGFDLFCALLRFDGVSEHYIGPPNDEALHLHPLYSHGLRPYDFWEIQGSPKAVGDLHHWVLTFHDETVEVVAKIASVVKSRIPGEDTVEIISSLSETSFNPEYAENRVDLKVLIQSGKTLDQALHHLRGQGMSLIQCIAAVKEHTGCGVAEAKKIALSSKAWHDVSEAIEKMWDDLINGVEEDKSTTPSDGKR
jgi:hypothetical protein